MSESTSRTHDPLCYLSFACLSSADGHHSHAVDGATATTSNCVVCNRDCVCYVIAKVREDERDKRQGPIDATLTLFSQDIRSLDNCVGDHEARLRTVEQILRGGS